MANYQKPYTPNNSFSISTLVLKLFLLLISCISFFLLAKLIIPHMVNLMPKFCTVLSAWMAPPYLFITVHLIILIIWKLSDHKPQHKSTADHQPFVKPKQHLSHGVSTIREISRGLNPQRNSTGEATDSTHTFSSEISPEIPKITRDRDILNEISRSDVSCVTQDEESKENSSSTASSRVEMRKISKPALQIGGVKLEHQNELIVKEENKEEENISDVDDSMDAMWKAIMEKVPTEKEASVGADEMNRHFDEFIKKSRDQIANRAF